MWVLYLEHKRSFLANSIVVKAPPKIILLLSISYDNFPLPGANVIKRFASVIYEGS